MTRAAAPKPFAHGPVLRAKRLLGGPRVPAELYEPYTALMRVAEMAEQAYRADAVASWFDEHGDGLRAALDHLKTTGVRV